MTWSRALLYALGYSALAYVVDVPVRRALAAKRARAYADVKGKPLLNVGAGTPGAQLWQDSKLCSGVGNSRCYPPTLYGDVNIDITAPRDASCGSKSVCYADAQDLSAFPDGYFGAVLASHVLEHLDYPDVATREWLRVVGGDRAALFIVTPAWWAPHAWLAPGHRWYVAPDLTARRIR